MQKHKTLLKYGENTIWLLAERGMPMVFSFVVGIFIARTLGPASFGLLNFAISYGLLFASLTVLGMDQILVKELVEHPENQNEILGSCIFLRFCGFLTMVAVVAGSVFIFESDRQVQIMVLLVLIGYIGVAMNGIDGFFQAKVQVRYTAAATILSSIIFSALNFWGCFNHYNLYFFTLTNSAIVLFSATVKWGMYNRFFGKIIQWRISMPVIKSVLRQSGWVFLQLTLMAVSSNIGYFIVKSYCSNEKIGYYSVILKITACCITIPEVICLSLFPAVIRARKDPENYRRHLDRFYYFLIWGGVAVVIGIYYLGPLLITLLYGASYADPGRLLWLGLCSLPLAGASLIFSRWCVLEQKQHILFLFSLGQMFGAVFITEVLAMRWGLTGAVLGFPLSFVCGWGCCLLAGKTIFTEIKNIFHATFKLP